MIQYICFGRENIMYYLIEKTLKKCPNILAKESTKPYVAIMSQEQWQKESEFLDLGIDMDFETLDIHTTMAEVNYNSITGSFALPYENDSTIAYKKFAYVINEGGIIFIDETNVVSDIINRISLTRKWRMPSLERFIYDFLEEIISSDLNILEKYEKQLAQTDMAINNKEEVDLESINEIRDHLRVLKTHYDRLIDLAQELEENENEFFAEDNIRYFSLFSKRAGRLFDMSTALVDYTTQIRDDYEANLTDKQNHIMTILTVVTTIFSPLTLITGWYGMNFKYMPELNSEYGYPAVFIISLLVAILSLLYFKHKKWL
jgi:magnesium transporter